MSEHPHHGFWPFDGESEPHVTPERVLQYFCEGHGLSPEQVALPPVMVATFQGAAYARILEQTQATDPSERHEDRSAQSSGLGRAIRQGSGGIGDLAVGEYRGRLLTVSRITVGAPAAALRLEAVIPRGIRDVLVVGSAGSLQPSLPLGSLVLVEAAEREDGTSHHYLPAGDVVSADSELSDLMEQAVVAGGNRVVRGRSWTIDAPYRETVGAVERHRAAGVAVVEMEAAAIFAVAKVRGIRAALLVAVSDELHGGWHPGFGDPRYLSALDHAVDAALSVARARGAGSAHGLHG